MSEKYKVRDQDKLHFITFAVSYWLDLFTRKKYRNILVESLRHCQQDKGLELYAWVIMHSMPGATIFTLSEEQIKTISFKTSLEISKRNEASLNAGFLAYVPHPAFVEIIRSMKTLQQRYFLSTKTFELQASKILIKEKSVFHDKEWEARYNELGLDLVKIKSREGMGNAILFGGLFIVTTHMTINAFTDGTDLKLAWLFVFFCFMWGTVFSWTIQKYFAAHFVLGGGHKTLDFFINSPDEATVRVFIETVRSRTKLKLKEDLTHFDPDLTFEEQLSHLKYLKNIEVLTKHEFECIREDLREKHLLK